MRRSTAEALAAAARSLAAVSATPRLDAELLLAHALGVSRERLLLGEHDVPRDFAVLLGRRLRGEPIAYIVGKRAFWTVDLEVGPGVLIPRPDSETLLEAAVAAFGVRAPRRVLDLGTGPGTLLLAALDEWPEATGLGIDRSEVALGYARRNGARIAPGRAEWRQGSWDGGIGERFDLVLCNPPYVAAEDPRLAFEVRAWEPHEALFADGEGLAAYREIVPLLPGLLASEGVACVELGAGQAAAVAALAAEAGLDATARRDLAGHERCLVVRRK